MGIQVDPSPHFTGIFLPLVTASHLDPRPKYLADQFILPSRDVT